MKRAMSSLFSTRSSVPFEVAASRCPAKSEYFPFSIL
jgi:hypothetical protein